MIRPYRVSDKDTVLSIWREANALAHPFLSPELTGQAEAMIRDTFLDMAETWLACPGGQPAGFIALLGQEVGGLFVRPGWQGRGLGRALMDHATARHGALELDVFAENAAARRFYRRYGFRETETRMNAFFGHPELRLRYDPA
ncbi:GNAT family N-acetyltransferase [Roseobacteraceae bacterium NS-SX3]